MSWNIFQILKGLPITSHLGKLRHQQPAKLARGKGTGLMKPRGKRWLRLMQQQRKEGF